MARPERKSADYFPLWNPHRTTIYKIRHYELKVRFIALRNSSSGFISKPDVREIIFRKGGNKCAFCGGKESLSIDHIVSVYKCARGRFPIEKLNIRENLQLLCRECNSRKKP